MMFALVALSLLGAAVALPTYGVPPVHQAPAYPVQPAPVVQTYPVYLPPQYNDAPVSNVRPGRDHGAFLDVFDGPHRHHHGHFHYPYYIHPGFGYDGPISNPFYTDRRHHGRPRGRHSHRDSRRGCDSRDSTDC